MKDFFRKHHRLLFYGSWILLGLIQSSLTLLEDDEAYYWVCSKFLAWGYFDHPPMIALMIKAGYALIPNELGVRLFPLLLNTLSILIIEKLVKPQKPYLFYAIVLSVAVLQTSGFDAVPDAPLIFFTAAFFWCYKKFTEKSDLTNALVLGLVTALLMYSKYHGVLVVAFTLLSNLKLFRQYLVYISGVTALVIYLPHLWWQYQHHWPSVQYHLFERNASTYKVSFTLEFILSQVVITGPIAGFILLPACLKYQTKDKTEKALRFTLAGIFIFFLISSFKGRVEANWTAPVVVPLIALAYLFISERARWQRALLRTLPYTLILVLFARFCMIFDFVPLHFVKARFHAWEKWPAVMKERTKGLPIVFSNSHQRAAKYWFYTGQVAYSQQLYKDRRSNYNFWPVEDSLLGKPVYFLDIYDLWRFSDSLKTPLGYVGYKYIPEFASFAKIKLQISPSSIHIKQGERLQLNGAAEIPSLYQEFIRSHSNLADTIKVGVFDKNGWRRDFLTPLSLLRITNNNHFSLAVDPQLPKGSYYLRFAIKSGFTNGTHNSEKIPLKID